ncbi:MAG TPA: FtsQ-type POTRA domain-containing protein [Candidatus Dormibacteraeota bacterium]|nr:FtsQ-type POTRA domain-containing protein [Candidatus Dormibacteraeota bacterium]
MSPPARQESPGRSFGAVVPDEFEAWRPRESARGRQPTARRRRPEEARATPRPIWGRIPDTEIEEVARQAAERRSARFAARQRFLGRHRVSAPRKPEALSLLREMGRVPKVLAVALVAATLAVVVMFALPWLKVQRVEVEGSSVVSQQQLLADAGARFGESTILLNAPAISRSLLAQPWVRDAAVHIRWPGTLVLAVTPLPAVLVYQQGSQQQSLAASGASLGPVHGLSTGRLPLLLDRRALGLARAGSVVLPARLTQALVALDKVFPASYDGVAVSRYVMTASGALEIESSAGWTADLGLALTNSQITSIGQKLEALRALGGQVNLLTAGIKDIYLEDPAQVAVTY